MNATLSIPHHIEEVQASDPHILVKLAPSTLSEKTLQILWLSFKPLGREGDDFRTWMRGCVMDELKRRTAVNDLLEPAAWVAPWHEWSDQELCAALATSWSYTLMKVTEESSAAFDVIHRAIVGACCTRLREIHEAIQRSQRKG